MTEATAEDVHHAHADGELRAPMPGLACCSCRCSVGDAVKAGQTVVVLESMKMELSLAAPVDGTVTELSVSVGDKVGRDEIVARVRMTHAGRWSPTCNEQLARVRMGGGEKARDAAHARAASCSRASASTGCSTRARRSSSSRRSPRTACTTATRRAPGSSPASAA